MNEIFAHRGSLAVTVLRDCQEISVIVNADNANNHIVAPKINALDAGSNTAHHTRILFTEADRHARSSCEKDVVVAPCVDDTNQIIAITQMDGIDSCHVDIAVVPKRRAFHFPVSRREQQEVLAFFKVVNRQAGDNLLLVTEAEKIDDGATLACSAAFGNLPDLEFEYTAEACETQQIGMRVSREEQLGEIIFFDFAALDAAAASALFAVCVQRKTLDIATVCDSDDHLVFGDEIANVVVIRLTVLNAGLSFDAPCVSHIRAVLPDDVENPLIV